MSLVSVASNRSTRSLANLTPNMNSYCFGHRFYYWEYYRRRLDKDDKNPGYTYRNWFIAKRYPNLRDEMLQNKTHSISRELYDKMVRKATVLCDSDAIRRLKCGTKWFVERYDGIQATDKISVKHILGMFVTMSFLSVS